MWWTMTPEQIIALVSAVLTGALTAFTAVVIKFLAFIRDERIRSEAQAKEFTESMARQGKETRDLVYRIVEQRDADIDRLAKVVSENAHAMGRNERVLEKVEHFLIQRAPNGAS
jgi:hypothetical protein